MSFESDWSEVIDRRSVDELLEVSQNFRYRAVTSATWEGSEPVDEPLVLSVSSRSNDVRPLELSFQEVDSFSYDRNLEIEPGIHLEPSGMIARIKGWEVRARSLAYRAVSAGKGYLAATMDSIDDVREELAKWSGTAARLWSYSVSHSVLVIRLHRPGVKGNLHIECLDVLSLSGPVGGSGASFVVEGTTRPHGRLAGLPILHLKDIGEIGISVYCEDIALEKNVDPLY